MSTAKKPSKTISLQSLVEMKEYRTTAADREERMRQRAESGEPAPTPDSTQPETLGDEEESEESLEKKKLERDIEKQQKELKRLERKKQQEEELSAKQKAKAFQDIITRGKWASEKNVPKIVSAEKRKKSAGFTSKQVKQEEEEAEEEEPEDDSSLPDGFHLLSDDIHCKNIRRAEGFIHYVRAICSQFENIVRKGTNVPSNYSKLVKSIYWVCRAIGIVSTEEADTEEVFDNIKDKTCRACMLHLRGITQALSYDLLSASRKESFIMRDSTLDDDMEALINKEVKGMTVVQENTIRNLIKDLCYHNKMAHRHTMESAEKLETLYEHYTALFP